MEVSEYPLNTEGAIIPNIISTKKDITHGRTFL